MAGTHSDSGALYLPAGRIKRGARTRIRQARRGGIIFGRARQAVYRPSGARVFFGKSPGVRQPHPRLSDTALRALEPGVTPWWNQPASNGLLGLELALCFVDPSAIKNGESGFGCSPRF